MSVSATTRVPEVGSQLVVFMFTDLVDSTALARQLGDADYVRCVLEPHNRLFRRLLAEFSGAKEVKHTGDGFMATFASASDAVECGLRLHHAMQGAAWERVAPRTRVGIHLGEAIEFAGASAEKRDLAGDAANMTARVMSLAGPGQTLMTRVAFDSARQSGRVRGDWLDADDHIAQAQIEWLNHGRYRLKGVDEPIEVCEVGQSGVAPLRAPADSEKACRVVSDEEKELLGWRPSPKRTIPHRADWLLEKPLGSGGFGEVWLAQHGRTRERRAFKFCFDSERLRSFKRELTFFRLIRDHLGERPDMARLYDVQVDRPPFFLEGEYVVGGNLKQWSDERGGIGALPVEQRLRLLAGVAQAVAAAHSLGIIHKDLKPSNVLVYERDAQPYPKLVDFGIGVLTDRSVLLQHQITETGFTDSLILGNESSRTGTRLYQPPEAQLNRPATTAGDVYALGVMLYQLITADLSRPLGTGWEEDVRDELLRDDIRACTHRDPERRLGSAAELAERLITLDQRREALEAQRRAARQARRLRQLRISLAIGAAILVVLGSLAAFTYTQWHRAARNEQRAIAGEREAQLQRDTAAAAQQLAEENAESARKQSLLAQQRLNLTELSAYNLQLRRVQELWRRDPGEALLLLEDESLCPDRLHEFTWQLLFELVNQGRLLLRGHQGPVRAIAFLPDHQRLVSGGYDGIVRIWDLESGHVLSTLQAETQDEVRAVAVSADGTRVAVCQDRTVRIWSLATQTLERSVDYGEAHAAAIAFAPDGQTLAVGDDSGLVKLWNVSTGDAIRTLRGHHETIHALAYSPDGSLLASASHDRTVRVWEAATGKRRFALTAHKGCVRCLAFTPDGNALASGSEDETVIVWDLSTGRQDQAMPMKDCVVALDFSPDGGTMVVVDQGRHLALRELTGARAEKRIPPSHRAQIWGLAISRDGRRLATASDDGDIVIRQWDTVLAAVDEQRMERSVQYGLSGTASTLSVSPRGDLLVSTQEESYTASIWELATGKKLHTLTGHSDCIRCAAFSGDGKLLATGASDRSIRLWNPETGEQIAILKGHTGNVSHLTFSADGKTLLSSSENRDEKAGEIRMWSMDNYQLHTVLSGAGEEIWCFAIAPDGRHMVTGGGTLYGVHAGQMTLWNLDTNMPIRQLAYRGSVVCAVAFSPDGKQLAAAANDGRILLWDPATFEQRLTLNGHASAVHGLAFSPDSRTLASAGHDATIRLWDPVTGHERATLEGHLACVRSVVFSPDGRMLYSGSEDRTIRVWGARPGYLSQRQASVSSQVIAGHVGIVSAVAFHPGGKLVASAGEDDKTVRVWNLETRQAVAECVGHEMAPRHVGFDPTGNLLSSAADTTIRCWDLASQAQTRILPGHSRYVATFAVSPDGRLLVSGAEDKQGGGELFSWDMPTGEKRTELRRTVANPLASLLFGGRGEEIWSVAFSPNGALLATGGGGAKRGELLLWNLADHQVRLRLDGHKVRVRCVSFSPDGQRLVSSDESGQIRISDVETGRELASFSAHGGAAFCVKFSPDGRLLATGGNDWIIRLWDANSCEDLATLEGHTRGVRSLDFSPDGDWLVSGSEDQTLRVWDLHSLRERHQ